jgi:cobalt-zinc-cadmium efflux system protein
MKNQRNILIAFILNLAFSVFELVGGIFTGSAAILSDAVHDLGDAAGIGVSFVLEKKSGKKPDDRYTYGYGRLSVLGSTVTTLLLITGSVVAMANAIRRIVTPAPINYNGMIVLAVVGLLVNGAAAFVTAKGKSLNQKAVSLHMLEDVLGWAVVLVGAVVMRFTNFSILDPILSLGVGVFILLHAAEHMQEGLGLFLEKVPDGIDVGAIKDKITALEGVEAVECFRLLSTDGQTYFASLQVSVSEDTTKTQIRKLLQEQGIENVVVEILK